MPVELDLESFARVQAGIRRPFAERDDVLQSAGVSETAFRDARAHWQSALADRDAEPLRERYREAFAGAEATMHAASRDARAEAARAEAATSKTGDREGPTPEAAAEPHSAVKFIPSYMLPAAPGPSSPSAHSVPPVAPLRAAAPPIFVFPEAVSPGPNPRPPRSAAARMASTAPVDLERLHRIIHADPTPFIGKTSPERLKELRAETSKEEEERFRRLASGADDADDTAIVQPLQSPRVRNQTLPFAANGAKVTYPEMSAERYAAFAAELHARGSSVEILDRYKITSAAALIALRAEQERRLDADPAARAHFEERKAHFIRFMKPLR